MDLELKQLQVQSHKATVFLPSSLRQSLGVKKAQVQRGNLQRSVEVLGKITRLDSTARNIITTPFAGELSFIADKQQGDDVQKGELLFSVRSDELDLMVEEYQLAIAVDNQALSNDLFLRLRQKGMGPEQIVELKDKAQGVAVSIPVYAQEAGFVFIRRGEVGSFIKPGFTIFNVGGDYQLAEVTAEIFERQWGRVKEGQQATMTLRNLPGVIFKGVVSRVEPPVGYTTRSLEIKLKFKIKNQAVSQSMFAQINIQSQERSGLLLVPSTAIIRTQNQNRVVKAYKSGEFEPTTVVVGEESQGMTEVISGLDEGNFVVTSGQFLIDSESQLQAGFERMKEVD
jgi:Cu(I)/Ag(I) efflux system membrane fusion protein